VEVGVEGGGSGWKKKRRRNESLQNRHALDAHFNETGRKERKKCRGSDTEKKNETFSQEKKENCNRKRPLRFVDFAGATGGTRRLLFLPFPLVPLVPFLPSFFPWLSPSFSLSLFLSFSLSLSTCVGLFVSFHVAIFIPIESMSPFQRGTQFIFHFISFPIHLKESNQISIDIALVSLIVTIETNKQQK